MLPLLPLCIGSIDSNAYTIRKINDWKSYHTNVDNNVSNNDNNNSKKFHDSNNVNSNDNRKKTIVHYNNTTLQQYNTRHNENTKNTQTV